MDLEPLPPPAEDLWDRIRKGYAMPELEDGYVGKWEAYYAERPDYVARMVDRSRRYLYHIVVEVQQRGMPLEIALLPMVESAFNPHAMSSARASGIWQFMPSTGTNYGLKQNFWFDSRRDVIAATEGALNYLQKLYAQFNDWQLSLAYRYLEADATVDAFTDSDFHLGGTNNKGFILGAQYGLGKNTWLSARWMSSNEISGLPLAVDVLQLYFNAKF